MAIEVLPFLQVYLCKELTSSGTAGKGRVGRF